MLDLLGHHVPRVGVIGGMTLAYNATLVSVLWKHQSGPFSIHDIDALPMFVCAKYCHAESKSGVNLFDPNYTRLL